MRYFNDRVIDDNGRRSSFGIQADSPEAQRYNRIRRWLGVADFAVGFAFLIVLLVTGWSGWLRDLRLPHGIRRVILCRYLSIAVAVAGISKALGIGP